MLPRTLCILNDADVNLVMISGDRWRLSFSVGDFDGQTHTSPEILLASTECKQLLAWLKTLPASAKSDAADTLFS